MNAREEFGSYVLLKKLYEDPLGETLRAGKMGPQGLDQVVLLRVFNGGSVDTDRLWSRLSGRGPVQDALKSPNVGSGVDVGRVRSVPYVAYDYISGKNLANLMEQARRERSAIPLDHALLIAERVALGLASGYETRVDDERVLHGFLVPQLVMLSNEGEIQVLGFEAAPGMRDAVLGGAVPPAFSRYVPPEALNGQPITKKDDVYSLGAVLFELLTGQAYVSGTDIDGAVLAAEGTPLPAGMVQLLKRSLAPAGERIDDVVTWHKALSKLMAEGQHNPTTFNLAFFMHNLFKDEIEEESREIEAERTIVTAAPHEGDATAVVTSEELASEQAAYAGTVDTYEKEEKKSSPVPLIAAAVVVLLLGLAAVWFFALRGGDEPTDVAETPPPATVPTTPAEDALGDGEEEGAAGPSEEELRAQIEQLLAERTAAMEESFRSEYDEQIKELQSALDQAEKEETRKAEKAAAEAQAEEQRLAQEETDRLAREAAQKKAAEEKAAEEEKLAQATPPTDGGQAAAGGTGAAAGTGNQAAGSRPASTPPTTAQPKEERVRVGDLVTPGPGVVAPRFKTMTDPRYPPLARRLNKRATVAVKVLVNENGRVDRTELAGKDPGYGFGDAALAAARTARFDAATKNGVRVKMWHTVKIEFTP